MNHENISKAFPNFIRVLRDDNIYEELSENDQSKMYLLRQCTDCLIKFDVMDMEMIENNIFSITSVIDSTHEDLHVGHWSSVPLYKRKLYFYSCYIKILYLVLAYNIKGQKKELCDDLRLAIKLADMALMMGVPLTSNPHVIKDIVKLLNTLISESGINVVKLHDIEEDSEFNITDNIQGITVMNCPSIESFKKSFYDTKLPVLLKNCISHWPALKKWRSLNYILDMAGNRTVPIELGSKYTDESWSQKLMTIKEFIQNHIIGDSPTKGYLAQHRLLDQIPELTEDICIPDYCCISDKDDSDPEINIWFGPKGTISPLHTDPKDNLLAQVVGVKQIVLFSPEDSKFLYPHEESILNNTSRIDLDNPDIDKYPLFKNVSPITCTLRTGDMLYIPPKWWHHVTSKTISISVSFWWE